MRICHWLLSGRSSRLTPVGGDDEGEDVFGGGIVASGGVEHGVIQMAGGPLGLVVMLDEGGAFLVHSVNQVSGLDFIVHIGQNTLVF